MRVKLLLHAFLILSLFSGTLLAKTYSEKTFLTPRAIGTNLPMELTTWHEYAYQKLAPRVGHRIKGHATITPFYQSSDEKHDAGEYFGIGNGENNFVIATVGSNLEDSLEVEGFHLIHNLQALPPLAGKVTFEPKQEIWGARFDYFQDVDHPIKGLFFKASMPIVYVENNMGMSITEEENTTVGGKTFSLRDFFEGKVEVTKEMDTQNLQSPLTHAKIAGRESKFGVADINLAAGYKFHQTRTSHLFLSAQIIVPTGPRPHGEHLFEPVLGNHKHFGLGLRLDSGVELWSSNKSAVRVLFDIDYRYLFQATESRTLGVKFDDNKLVHYYLAGKINQINKPLFPLANILTQGIRVKPGNQFDVLADLSFKSSGFVLDLGYNFFYKDEESAWRKDKWQDGVYGIAETDYPTDQAFNNNNPPLQYNVKTINSTDLDVDAVKTPTQITHKIFAGLGYQFDITKKLPALLGIGGSYEFSSDNAALDNYSVWVKLGMSF